MTTKAKGESVRQKLTAVSTKLSVQYKNIETIFMIERLVARLIADKNLANHLVFKGGFVGLKIYESPRFTIDLDALLVKASHEDISWSVYPIETICAEKLHALISHGDENSRSKDVHDLAVFLPKVDSPTLKKALKKCFDFRSTDLPTSFHAEIKKLNTSRLERGWDSAVGSVANATDFKTAFNKVVKLISELEEK